jgi:hypothetical protein
MNDQTVDVDTLIVMLREQLEATNFELLKYKTYVRQLEQDNERLGTQIIKLLDSATLVEAEGGAVLDVAEVEEKARKK